MRRLAAGATSLVTGLVLVAMPGVAHAAPGEMGNGCVANGQDPGVTTLMTAKAASNPLPVSAPTTGVITKARFAMPPAFRALCSTGKKANWNERPWLKGSGCLAKRLPRLTLDACVLNHG